MRDADVIVMTEAGVKVAVVTAKAAGSPIDMPNDNSRHALANADPCPLHGEHVDID